MGYWTSLYDLQKHGKNLVKNNREDIMETKSWYLKKTVNFKKSTNSSQSHGIQGRH